MNDWLFMTLYLPFIGAVAFFVILFYKKEKRQAEADAISARKYPYLEKTNLGADMLGDNAEAGKDSELEELYERLVTYIERDRPFLDPDIRVADVSEKLYTNKNYLAQAIRICGKTNFVQLINSYRVQEAMKIYAANTSLTITQLCRRVGFKSMTTFNSAFTRFSGYTPAEWCREYRKCNEQ